MPRFLKIYMWPIWFFQLFGESKSFIANPIIGSRFLNMMGLHVIRVILSHASANIRWFMLRPKMPKELRAQFHRDGYVTIENYLSEEDFNALRKDVANCKGIGREMTQGDTYTQRILLDDDALTDAPHLKNFITDKGYTNLLSYGAAKNYPALIYLHRIRNGVVSGGADPQKNLHSDTFHPNMKAWYYLDDVPLEKGPFNFVPGSHRLTWKRLKWEYKKSLISAKVHDGYSEKGSLRALDSDLAEMGLPSAKALTVKANTLVLGNPHGFHCRGQADTGSTRYEIWAYGRHNPFNIWPGLYLSIFGKWEKAAMQRYWAALDTKAAKKGHLSTWHPVETAAITDENWKPKPD